MKSSLIFLAYGLIFLGPVCAQKLKRPDVPERVSAAFKSSSPGIHTEKWGKENGNFEAEYMVGKVEHTTVLTPEGILVQTEIAIKPTALPPKVLASVRKFFKGVKISEAAEITGPDGKKSYEAEIRGMDYIYDLNGQLLTTVKD